MSGPCHKKYIISGEVVPVPIRSLNFTQSKSLQLLTLSLCVSVVSNSNNLRYPTSNVTRCHQGPKQKLRAGYRAPSLQCISYFSTSSVVSRVFSVLCMYLKFGHHPHPLGYLCAKFCCCGKNRTLNSINQSLHQNCNLGEILKAIWKMISCPQTFGTQAQTDLQMHGQPENITHPASL